MLPFNALRLGYCQGGQLTISVVSLDKFSLLCLVSIVKGYRDHHLENKCRVDKW